MASWNYMSVMDSRLNGPSPVDRGAVLFALESKGIATAFHEEIVNALPSRAIGVLLYGSVARGDVSPESDIDLLVVADRPSRTQGIGRVNRTTYEPAQLASASGTLFGLHINRDSVVLHDAGGVATAISEFGPIDVPRLKLRLARLSLLLELSYSDIEENLSGLVRHARYVLRTATYLVAIEHEQPCFSVSELADRFADPELRVLLSSHSQVQGPPSMQVFFELRERVRSIVGTALKASYTSLKDAAIGYGSEWPEVGDAATLILSQEGSDSYTTIPRVIL